MSGNKSKTVFHRTNVGFEANDPDGWNDLAIISAYDKAVAPDLKMDDVEVDKPSASAVPAAGAITTEAAQVEAKRAKKRKRKLAKKLARSNRWNIGDSCMAFYQEDQRYYKAVVKEVHAAQGTVVISYADYDEDEVVAVKDIYPEHLWTNAGVDLNLGQPQTSRKPAKATKKAKMTNPRNRNRPSSYPNNIDLSYESSLPFMPNMGDMEPDMHTGMPNFRNMARDCSNIPKEALSSMLVSWYMAGYQTGYYRGLTTTARK